MRGELWNFVMRAAIAFATCTGDNSPVEAADQCIVGRDTSHHANANVDTSMSSSWMTADLSAAP